MNLCWQLICVILFGAACWAFGDLFLQRFFNKGVALSSVARHSLAFTAGNVAFSYLLTLFGFLGFFIPPFFWTIFVVGAGFAVWRVVLKSKDRLGPILEMEVRHVEGRECWSTIFLITLMVLFFLPAVFQAAAPPYARDSLVYHLLCPKEYLKTGNIHHIPGNIFSAFPKGHEVLLTLLMAIGGDRAAQGFSVLQQLAAVGGLYSLIRLLTGPWPSTLCTLGYLTVPPVIYFTGCGYVEPALVMTFVNSLLALTLYSHDGIRPAEGIKSGEIAFIGFLSGWLVALKYSGLIYLGLIGLILLWGLRRVSLKRALSFSGIFILAAAPGFYWMIWNWVTLGNPVYPMAWFLFGGTGWDESRTLAMSMYFDRFGMGRSLSSYLLLPWRISFLGKFDTIRFDGAIGPFLFIFATMAVVTAVLMLRRRLTDRVLKAIGLMFVVSAAFFVFGTQQTRFWLPSQILLCILAAPSVKLLLDWTRNKSLIRILLFLVVVGSLVWNAGFLKKQLIAIGYYKPVLGIESEHAFLVRKVPGYSSLEFINQNIPTHSRVLCVWTGSYGYYINRSYYSDTFIEDFTLKKFIEFSSNGKDLSRRLSEAGFTHLFFRPSILVNNMTSDQKAIFSDFMKEGAVEIFKDQDFSVYEILSRSRTSLRKAFN